MSFRWSYGLRAVFVLSLLCSLSSFSHADSPYDIALKSLPWRSIGPAAMGGRIDQFAVVESRPGTIYCATASGGVFKTVNNGTTWDPIFDNQRTTTVGSVAVAPSNPDIVWVGTGEANNRQSSSWGDGVYKSADAGKTWTFMGLPETSAIGEILIDPRNPDVVYVAALGHLWKANSERGLYKTMDGGKTWNKVLYINEDTGITDAKFDVSNPDVIFAAAYQRRRTPFGYNGGGPGSGLFKSVDGGTTWKKLTQGLPAVDMGRIGIGTYRKDSKIVYVILEDTPGGIFATTGSGGVYRSDDSGESWTKQSNITPRPMYYSHVFVDPNNDKNVWVLGVNLHYSTDAGKTWVARPTQKIHSDFHAFWIDPANSNHFLAGCDGGIWWTWDNGRTWDYNNNIAIGQFYEIAYDFKKPYWVYGGLQDNYSWGGPTATPYAEGATNDDWINIGGGDGFFNMVDYSDSNIVYQESQNGGVTRINVATGERKSIKPRPLPGEPAYRFDWNTPLLISSHNPKKIFMGGERLFISDNRGDSWRRTVDLSSKPDRSKMPIMGKLPRKEDRILSLDDGQDTFGQIITLTESPVKEGLIYVGCDDGSFQMSRDDGKTWKRLEANVPGVPKGTYVVRLVASRYAEGRIYAAFDNHRNGDFMPYLLVSEDFGTTWQPITKGIPEGSTLHVIREHHRNPNLLFAGTERGAYVSFDRGANWSLFGAPLPIVPVDDIQIHPRENDLILGTHGRSIWVLDDITPLEQIAENTSSANFYLFTPRPAVEWRISSKKGFQGDRLFMGQNPPPGALIQFYLKREPTDDEPMRLTFLEKDGKTPVAELRFFNKRAGVNRVYWDMRYGTVSPTPPPTPPAGATTNAAGTTGAGRQGGARGRGGRGGGGAGGGGRGGAGGGGGGFQGGRQPRVLPGDYFVRLTFGKEEIVKPLKIEEDPRLPLTVQERKTHFTQVTRLSRLNMAASAARTVLSDTREEVGSIDGQEGFKNAPASLKEAVEKLEKRLSALDRELVSGSARQAPEQETEEEREERERRGPEKEVDPDKEGVPDMPDAPRAVAIQTPQEDAAKKPAPAPPVPVIPIAQRVTMLLQSLDSITELPSPYFKQQSDELTRDLSRIIRELNTINEKEIPALNKQLEAAKLKPIKTAKRVEMPK